MGAASVHIPSWGFAVPLRGVTEVRAPFLRSGEELGCRMNDLKPDSMSRIERVILFLILAVILIFWEMAKKESGTPQNSVERNIGAK